MAKVGTKIIRFAASPSPDVVDNRIYYSTEQGLDYSDSFVEVGNEADAEGNITVDLGQYFGGFDGNYFIGVAAVDDAGNEADIQEYPESIPLDFQAPEPVGQITLL